MLTQRADTASLKGSIPEQESVDTIKESRIRIDTIDRVFIDELKKIKEVLNNYSGSVGESYLTKLMQEHAGNYFSLLLPICSSLANEDKNGGSTGDLQENHRGAIIKCISRLVVFLNSRFDEVEKIGMAKVILGLPERNDARWKEVEDSRVALAQEGEIKVSESGMKAMLHEIHEHAIAIEEGMQLTRPEIQSERLLSSPSLTLGQEFFDVSGSGKDCIITIQPVQPGSRFASHFPGKPIVPGVALTLLIGRSAYGSGLNTSTREFLKPVLPGDILELRVEENDIQLVSINGGDEEVKARFYDKTGTVNYGEVTIENLLTGVENGKVGKDLVPHGDNFRFVDTAWTLSPGTGNDKELLSQSVHGTYILKECDTENGEVPWWLLEESAAQMMLGAYRSYMGPESEIMTYGKAETQVYSNEKVRALQPGDTLILRGRFIDKQKRTATGEYDIYVLNAEGTGELLFSGRITGNLIPLKVWNR